MASNDDKTLNINIYKDHSKEIELSKNKSETYIILVNEDLSNKLREQLENIYKLNEKISELENDNESMEKTITCQRGLLHNFNGIKNQQNKKIICYETYNNNINASIKKDFKNLNYLYRLYYSNMIFLCFSIFIINYIMNESVFTIFNNTVTTITFSFLLPFIFKLNTDFIKKLEEKYMNITDILLNKLKVFDTEINKITSQTDFISELIDSV